MNNAEGIDSLTDKDDFVVFMCFRHQDRLYRELARIIGPEKFLEVAVKFPGAMRTPVLKRLSNVIVLYRLAKLQLDAERAGDRKDWFALRQLSARAERLAKSEGYTSQVRRAALDEAVKNLKEARAWWNQLENLEQTKAFTVKL